jgi:hypothetical protein
MSGMEQSSRALCDLHKWPCCAGRVGLLVVTGEDELRCEPTTAYCSATCWARQHTTHQFQTHINHSPLQFHEYRCSEMSTLGYLLLVSDVVAASVVYHWLYMFLPKNSSQFMVSSSRHSTILHSVVVLPYRAGRMHTLRYLTSWAISGYHFNISCCMLLDLCRSAGAWHLMTSGVSTCVCLSSWTRPAVSWGLSARGSQDTQVTLYRRTHSPAHSMKFQ